jgi:hypothetical protein
MGVIDHDRSSSLVGRAVQMALGEIGLVVSDHAGHAQLAGASYVWLSAEHTVGGSQSVTSRTGAARIQ